MNVQDVPHPDVDTSVRSVHGTELAASASRVVAGFLNAQIFQSGVTADPRRFNYGIRGRN
jgi:hypothetical protein